MIKYFNVTNKNDLTLSDDGFKMIQCYFGASFAVHPDFKIHTGEIVTMGQGVMQ